MLAKSSSRGQPPPSWAQLGPHLRAVETAGGNIVKFAGADILQALGLDADPWQARLAAALPLAGLLHDVGKANSAFQTMVRSKSCEMLQQPLRHEIVSALWVLNDNQLHDWVAAQARAVDPAVEEQMLNAIIGAVIGHHVKHDPDWTKAAQGLKGGCGLAIEVYKDVPALTSIFGKLAIGSKWSTRAPDLEQHRLQIAFASKQWQQFLQHDPEWRRFAGALKALTMAADVVGSAVLPAGVDQTEWARTTLSRRCDRATLEQVAAQRLGDHAPRPFQRAVANSTARITLVEAGCGAGKTVAAWLWAAKHADDRKLFFCYPTTGTATEGFLDYAALASVESDLLHSRAAVDLEDVGVTDEDDADERTLRFRSLRAWGPQAIVCTADTVLGLVRNNRQGLYNSPAFLVGTFVFDEVHAYDDTMFAALAVLMEALPGAHFLLMSASLPPARKTWLRKRFPGIAEAPVSRVPEAIPRYRLHQAESKEQLLSLASDVVENGDGQVLWIVNTVQRAQDLHQHLCNQGLSSLCYHSRFKYEDRKCVHRRLMDAFGKSESKGLIAITTQVAEMSLDLDATLLISELAPPPSLIQRLGRLNRHVTPDKPGEPRSAWFLAPETEAPYQAHEIRLAQEWVNELRSLDRALSQFDLVKTFHELNPPVSPEPDLRSEWLDSGWYAFPGPVREAALSVNIVLPEDAGACRRQSAEIVRRSIPMSWRPDMQDWPSFKGILLAPHDCIHYDSERGATWAT